MDARTRTLGVLLFEEFELLDVFGPLEMFGMLMGDVRIALLAEHAGPVKSAQGPAAVAEALDSQPRLDLILVPGGMGTRTEVSNERVLGWLRERAATAEITMSVCTGSALLAKAGLLSGRRATTNKMIFPWVVEQDPTCLWVREARWVDDGNIVTSSGVSAGMDMSLAVIERLYGSEASRRVADAAEYDWHRDAGWDPFAKLYGLAD